MQSKMPGPKTSGPKAPGLGLHVAIIMDGNGRWATRQGLPRSAGHRAGMEAVRRAVEAAADLGVSTLTLFAFSTSNWKRPGSEVDTLMWLFRGYLRADLERFADAGARLSIIGRRDRIPAKLRREIQAAERATSRGRRLHLRVAIDYSSREAIARAAAAWSAGAVPDERAFGDLVAGAGGDGLAEVDLLIRTGGEKRLSDFLLWEAAFAELWFTDRMWPEFERSDLQDALADFHGRERRFGALSSDAPASVEAPEQHHAAAADRRIAVEAAL
jgi:undecaprenyl diphosphate synthase